MTDTAIHPTFDAYRTVTGKQLTFFCPSCEAWHYHGSIGPNPGDGDGHRSPHCPNRSELTERGYLLREVGPITREVIAGHRCKRGQASTRPALRPR